jgi:hypothetical protein
MFCFAFSFTRASYNLTCSHPATPFHRADTDTDTAVSQSVRDLQSVLVFDVHRVFGLAKAMAKGNQQRIDPLAQLTAVVGGPCAAGLMELRQINSLGDIYVRQKFWEESLEVRCLF